MDVFFNPIFTRDTNANVRDSSRNSVPAEKMTFQPQIEEKFTFNPGLDPRRLSPQNPGFQSPDRGPNDPRPPHEEFILADLSIQSSSLNNTSMISVDQSKFDGNFFKNPLYLNQSMQRQSDRPLYFEDGRVDTYPVYHDSNFSSDRKKQEEYQKAALESRNPQNLEFQLLDFTSNSIDQSKNHSRISIPQFTNPEFVDPAAISPIIPTGKASYGNTNPTGLINKSDNKTAIFFEPPKNEDKDIFKKTAEFKDLGFNSAQQSMGERGTFGAPQNPLFNQRQPLETIPEKGSRVDYSMTSNNMTKSYDIDEKSVLLDVSRLKDKVVSALSKFKESLQNPEQGEPKRKMDKEYQEINKEFSVIMDKYSNLNVSHLAESGVLGVSNSNISYLKTGGANENEINNMMELVQEFLDKFQPKKMEKIGTDLNPNNFSAFTFENQKTEKSLKGSELQVKSEKSALSEKRDEKSMKSSGNFVDKPPKTSEFAIPIYSNSPDKLAQRPDANKPTEKASYRLENPIYPSDIPEKTSYKGQKPENTEKLSYQPHQYEKASYRSDVEEKTSFASAEKPSYKGPKPENTGYQSYQYDKTPNFEEKSSFPSDQKPEKPSYKAENTEKLSYHSYQYDKTSYRSEVDEKASYKYNENRPFFTDERSTKGSKLTQNTPQTPNFEYFRSDAKTDRSLKTSDYRSPGATLQMINNPTSSNDRYLKESEKFYPKTTMENTNKTMENTNKTMENPNKIKENPNKTMENPNKTMENQNKTKESQNKTMETPIKPTKKIIESPIETIEQIKRQRKNEELEQSFLTIRNNITVYDLDHTKNFTDMSYLSEVSVLQSAEKPKQVAYRKRAQKLLIFGFSPKFTRFYKSKEELNINRNETADLELLCDKCEEVFRAISWQKHRENCAVSRQTYSPDETSQFDFRANDEKIMMTLNRLVQKISQARGFLDKDLEAKVLYNIKLCLSQSLKEHLNNVMRYLSELTSGVAKTQGFLPIFWYVVIFQRLQNLIEQRFQQKKLPLSSESNPNLSFIIEDPESDIEENKLPKTKSNVNVRSEPKIVNERTESLSFKKKKEEVNSEEEIKNYFFTEAVNLKFALPSNHPKRKILISDLYEEARFNGLKIEEFRKFIKEKLI